MESEAIWTELKELGCDVGQGYYFSRPVPPAELNEWIAASAGSTPAALLKAGDDVPPAERPVC